jgi:hypothetical protein
VESLVGVKPPSFAIKALVPCNIVTCKIKMSIGAPSVQLDEVLSTVEFGNSVYIAPEEKLTVRSAAISMSNSQLTFQCRQPSPQAILENQPRLELVLQYTYTRLDDSVLTNLPAVFRDNNVTNARVDNVYGLAMEGYPFLSKCVKTLSCTQNGCTTTYRPSVTFKSYLQANTTRDFMERNGTPWNDYTEQYVVDDHKYNDNVN